MTRRQGPTWLRDEELPAEPLSCFMLEGGPLALLQKLQLPFLPSGWSNHPSRLGLPWSSRKESSHQRAILCDGMHDYNAPPVGSSGRLPLIVHEPKCIKLMAQKNVAFAHEHENAILLRSRAQTFVRSIRCSRIRSVRCSIGGIVLSLLVCTP